MPSHCDQQYIRSEMFFNLVAAKKGECHSSQILNIKEIISKLSSSRTTGAKKLMGCCRNKQREKNVFTLQAVIVNQSGQYLFFFFFYRAKNMLPFWSALQQMLAHDEYTYERHRGQELGLRKALKVNVHLQGQDFWESALAASCVPANWRKAD